MQLSNLDLNLLVSLDVLLEERSVTRAAARLGLSQPALSGALARLRRHFDDPLLIRSGNTSELSPLAQALRLRTSHALNEVERVFASEAVFTPAASRRTFTVQASDYAMAVLGPRIARVLADQAPGVMLRFETHSSTATDSPADLLRGVDGMILPRGFVFDLPAIDLFTDEWVCVADQDNDAVGEALTMTDIAEMPWVLTYHGSARFLGAVRQLEQLGIEPRVEAVVESFLALPFYIAGTRRLGLVQRHLADLLAPGNRLRVLACPWDVVPVVETLWWHPLHTRDPGHAWLRSVITETARRL
ncbi:LysR substrate-binding domain-containing protein [Amycolatopsis solani]|uniref:LysR substrate-binding domain-containing protein n=1 Tax=Amycolatopsis solani TaxID=3028615 RepID=UPI0025AF7C57|nr:LysR family transcriptional regulator [Amycolatopsis sp. MEP2-6]